MNNLVAFLGRETAGVRCLFFVLLMDAIARSPVSANLRWMEPRYATPGYR
ncbi:hypothetical protein [Microcoleus sp. herbarium12]